jgi:uncharacterized membrane protein
MKNFVTPPNTRTTGTQVSPPPAGAKAADVLGFLGAAFGIVVCAVLIYWPVLSVASSTAIPWGSDTLGHVSRLDFLASSIQPGSSVPDIYPDWYLGMQLFRYYPPFTYYVLILIQMFTGQAVLAVNWFIVLCALVGGLSFLLFKKWIGWLPALGGGLIYLVLPDNVRVAFSEGNLPRVLASAFVPLLL